MKVVDLFSGLGGFSQAFIDRGHNVVRFDNDEQFKEVQNTIICDVLDLTPEDLCDYLWDRPNIILASPPCTHFSVAALSHHWPKGVPTHATLEQIKLVRSTIALIKKTNPTYWILENPRGMLRKAIGKPAWTAYWAAYGAKVLKPTDLWGKLPPIDRKLPFKWERAPRGTKLGVQGISVDKYKSFKKNPFSHVMPRSPTLRALIPYDFSMAVCLAAEGNSPQQTLEEYVND